MEGDETVGSQEFNQELRLQLERAESSCRRSFFEDSSGNELSQSQPSSSAIETTVYDSDDSESRTKVTEMSSDELMELNHFHYDSTRQELINVFEIPEDKGISVNECWRRFFSIYLDERDWIARLIVPDYYGRDITWPLNNIFKGQYLIKGVNLHALHAIGYPLDKPGYSSTEIPFEYLVLVIEDQPKNVKGALYSSTQLALRLYRTFKIRLSYTRDTECGQTWMTEHLDTRLRFDKDLSLHRMKEPTWHSAVAMMKEMRLIELDIEGDEDTDSSGDETEQEQRLRATAKQIRLDEICTKLKHLENPGLRSVVEYTNRLKLEKFNEKVFLVMGTTSMQHLKRIREEALTYLEDQQQTMRIVSSMNDVLQKASSGVTVFVTPGTHYIQDLGALESGGRIIGLDGEGKIVVKPQNTDEVFLFFHKDEGNEDLEIQNVEFRCCTTPKLTRVMYVSKGDLFLTNCTIHYEGEGKSLTGVVCGSRTDVILRDVTFKSLLKGLVVADSTGSVRLEESVKFEDCITGIEVPQLGLISGTPALFNSCQRMRFIKNQRTNEYEDSTD